jgi:hypothetical protein
VHLLGVALNSRIKSSEELVRESFLATLPNLGLNPECVFDPVRQWSMSSLTRIGTRGTILHRLRRSKEESATTQLTIRKILEDYDVLLKA